MRYWVDYHHKESETAEYIPPPFECACELVSNQIWLLHVPIQTEPRVALTLGSAKTEPILEQSLILTPYKEKGYLQCVIVHCVEVLEEQEVHAEVGHHGIYHLERCHLKG